MLELFLILLDSFSYCYERYVTRMSNKLINFYQDLYIFKSVQNDSLIHNAKYEVQDLLFQRVPTWQFNLDTGFVARMGYTSLLGWV